MTADDTESESDGGGGGSDGVRLLASIPLPHGARLCVSAGSVLDVGEGEGGQGWARAKTAVVNAANTGGLGGAIQGSLLTLLLPLFDTFSTLLETHWRLSVADLWSVVTQAAGSMELSSPVAVALWLQTVRPCLFTHGGGSRRAGLWQRDQTATGACLQRR